MISYCFRTPDICVDWNKTTGKIDGMPFNYFTCGAALSEVEIDCLTGDHTVLRTDIVMDVGRSLNPTVDIGQASSIGDIFISIVLRTKF